MAACIDTTAGKAAHTETPTPAAARLVLQERTAATLSIRMGNMR
jgi:hypothetical protein